MAWYSYFLISLPETIGMILVLTGLLGLQMKMVNNRVAFLIVMVSTFNFSATLWINNPNMKLLLSVAFMIVAVNFLLKIKFQHAVILTIISTLFLMIYEISCGLLEIAIWDVKFTQAIENPWLRILLASPSIFLMFMTAWIIKKFRLHIKLPGISEYKQ